MTIKPTFVIGDLHGHYDRLEALLKQEGIIGRCPICHGSGIIHNSECPSCVGDGICRINHDVEIVLLGDIGHFGQSGSPTGDLLTWRAATLWADVILWGNHDRATIASQHAHRGLLMPGPETKSWMVRAESEGKLKLAHSSHGFLFTHAGLHLAFRDQKVDESLKTDPTAFADWINESENSESPSADQIAIRDAISVRRNGNARYGGILWRDINEKLYGGFRQIFGHSADHKERMVRYCDRNIHTRHPDMIENPSYCIDIGGKDDRGPQACLMGIWLPEERIVRIDL